MTTKYDSFKNETRLACTVALVSLACLLQLVDFSVTDNHILRAELVDVTYTPTESEHDHVSNTLTETVSVGKKLMRMCAVYLLFSADDDKLTSHMFGSLSR